MRPLAVFDIDGVLADVAHRVHHLEGRPDWAAFFAAAIDDAVHAEGLAMAVEAAETCDLAFVTGRPERCRRDTQTWLRRERFPEGVLVMRGNGDRRPARMTKLRLLRDVARGREVAVVVDDDPSVCAAYERAGWPVLRATWAPHSRALYQAQEADGRT